MADIEFEIDGKLVIANQGDSIISIADREGIDIPRFCYHKKLSSCCKLQNVSSRY